MHEPSSDSPERRHSPRDVLSWFDIRRHPVVVSLEIAFLILLLGGGIRRWNTPVIAIQADGKIQTYRTHVKTVGDALAERNIVLGKDDFCLPPPADLLQRHTTIKVVRVTRQIETETQTTPLIITEQTRLTGNLRKVLVRKGVVKEIVRRVEKTLHNGTEASRKILKSKVIKHPSYTLTLLKNNNLPEKVYDLSKCKVLHLRATGYYVGEKYVPSDTTYLGFKLQRGLVAVDPTVIPLGTRLYVKGYGYAYAADTGSAIKGLRIDLAVKDKYEEAKFNRYNVPVYILEKSKTW